MSARERLGPLRRLRRAREWLLLIRVMLVAGVVPGLLRLPLPTVERILCGRRRARRGTPLEPERVAAVVEAAQALAHPLVRRGCLTRGVTLFWLLREPGQDRGLRLCFGLGGADDGFTGHCWLERDRTPFLEKVDPRARFPEQYAIPRSHTALA